MSERLRQFVLDVSNDPDRAKRLTADPVAELERSDLDPEEKQVILSRNPDVVRQALGAERFDLLSMNSFFKQPAKPRPGKPAGRKPVRKAPAKKKKKGPARKTTRKPARKATRKPARKATRKPARKGSRGRRG